MTGVFIKKWKSGCRDKHREEDVKIQGENELQAKEHPRPPEAGGRPGEGSPSQVSEGTDPADTLLSDLWPSELRGDTFPLFKQSNRRHCVKAAWEVQTCIKPW